MDSTIHRKLLQSWRLKEMTQEPEFDLINILLGTIIITEIFFVILRSLCMMFNNLSLILFIILIVIFIKNISIMYKEMRIFAGL